MPKTRHSFILSLNLLFISLLHHSVHARKHSPLPSNIFHPSDAQALLDFKSKADLKNNLPYSKNTTLHFCKWAGVTCTQNKVVRLIVQNSNLGGIFASNTLSHLDQLRVLTLQNNSLSGPIPDLAGLLNLKTLFLDHNSFTGTFPASVSSLNRLKTLDISFNNLTGSLPAWLSKLDRLIYLKLEWNQFSGSVPALNQSSLKIFNVSCNNLTGAIPVTQTFLHFGHSAFAWNLGLCGEIVHIACHPRPPFFPVTVPPPPHAEALGQSAEVHGGTVMNSTHSTCKKKHARTGAAVVIAFSAGICFLVFTFVCFVMAVKKHRSQKGTKPFLAADITAAATLAEQDSELEEKVKKAQDIRVAKSGNLVFCAGEPHLYSLDQLMRSSAELLGRGTMGTTYKAVMDNGLIVTVKRLDATKLGSASKDVFEQHMESVGGLRHPNLVPLRAYFQAKEERILVYDYQPNGSLFSLVHGSKSARAKPLHWTSCLKIAEDVAQGISYIHQAWRLVHGNLKSSNVLLGPDFEACITDYCLSVLGTSSYDEDPDSAAYKAPETRNINGQATTKSDVYAYGVLLMELLTGKPPSQHPFLVPDELMQWVRSVREEDSGDDGRLKMLFEVAVNCSLTSPEQRPTMWQVLKMIQEIKETVLLEDTESTEPFNGLT